VKILDFGLAKLRRAKVAAGASSEVPHRKHSQTLASVMGTVGYMSPEQVRGQDVDHRSDHLLASAMILYEMLSGSRPFVGDSAVELMNAILKDDVPD
jgi:serine/threonine protein kinase